MEVRLLGWGVEYEAVVNVALGGGLMKQLGRSEVICRPIESQNVGSDDAINPKIKI